MLFDIYISLLIYDFNSPPEYKPLDETGCIQGGMAVDYKLLENGEFVFIDAFPALRIVPSTKKMLNKLFLKESMNNSQRKRPEKLMMLSLNKN